jgi:hypothetical protein
MTPQPTLSWMLVNCCTWGMPSKHQEERRGQEGRQQGEGEDGQELAHDERAARHRVEQQRLQRLALALAGGRVHGQVEAAIEDGRHHHHRQQVEHEAVVAAGRARRGADPFDRHGVADGRADAAGQQAQAADLVAVLADERLGAVGGEAAALVGVVHQQPHLGRRAARERLAELVGDDQHHGQIAAPHGLFGIGRRFQYIDVVLVQELHQVGRVGRAEDVQRQRPLRLLGEGPVQEAEQHHVEQRVDEHGEQRVAHRAAVAQVVNDLFLNDDPQTPEH